MILQIQSTLLQLRSCGAKYLAAMLHGSTQVSVSHVLPSYGLQLKVMECRPRLPLH